MQTGHGLEQQRSQEKSDRYLVRLSLDLIGNVSDLDQTATA